jgi:hypothetical protein
LRKRQRPRARARLDRANAIGWDCDAFVVQELCEKVTDSVRELEAHMSVVYFRMP